MMAEVINPSSLAFSVESHTIRFERHTGTNAYFGAFGSRNLVVGNSCLRVIGIRADYSVL